MTLILASASASRQALLRAAAVPFQARPSHVDEAALKAKWQGSHTDLALALAHAKAQAVAQTASADDLVLGADQLLVCEGRLFDKARDPAQARANFEFLRGKRQTLISGVALWQNGKQVWEANVQSHITLRQFSDALLEQYLRAEAAWLTKVVGGCRYEGPALQLVEQVEGDYWSILGLPLLQLLPQLRRYGIVGD